MDGMVQGKRVEIRLSPEHLAPPLTGLTASAEAIVRLVGIGLEAPVKKKAKSEAKK